MAINKKTREIIYKKYNGKCAYCGCDLPKKWHVDHIKPVIRDAKYVKGKGFVFNGKMLNPENDILENYNPSCPSCNIMKHSSDIEGFKLMIASFVKSLNKYSNQYKFAKKFGLVKETGVQIQFYFEIEGSRSNSKNANCDIFDISGSLLIPDVHTEKNLILARAINYIADDVQDNGNKLAREIVKELITLLDKQCNES